MTTRDIEKVMKEHASTGASKRGSSLTPGGHKDSLKPESAMNSRPSNVSIMSVQSQFGETDFLNLHRLVTNRYLFPIFKLVHLNLKFKEHTSRK